MSLNVDELREGLKEYRLLLEMHNGKLDSRFFELQELYHHLAAYYEGEAARIFKESWMATADWFTTYIDGTKKLNLLLEERLTFLEQERE